MLMTLKVIGERGVTSSRAEVVSLAATQVVQNVVVHSLGRVEARACPGCVRDNRLTVQEVRLVERCVPVSELL